MWLLPWLVAISLLGVFSSGENVEVELGPDQRFFHLLSKGYPEPIVALTNQSWTITSPEGSSVKLVCYDIRLHQSQPSTCNIDLMVVDLGNGKVEDVCGTHYNKDYISESNRMEVRLTTGSYLSGGVKCIAEAFREVEEAEEIIELKVGGPSVIIQSPNYPNHMGPLVRKSWEFRVPEGARIRILFKDFRTYESPEGCTDSGVKITDGDKVTDLCGSKIGFTMLSSGETLRLDLRTGDSQGGAMEVEAWGKEMDWYGEVTPPPTTEPPPFLGIESEEIDSNEHGVPKGKKETTCPCGWANKESGRIVGGKETLVNEYPFMAAVVNKGRRYSFCGASIITHYHALTASHCIDGEDVENLSIVIGEHDQSIEDETDLTEEIPVAKILMHEEYYRPILKHDISILVLERPIEFNQFIGPVCLSRLQEDIAMQYVRNIGWGRVRHNESYSTVLRKVDTRVIHLSSCNKHFPYYISTDKPTQICTYSHEKASCQGDSGGPVLWLDPETNRYTQRGIVSWGTVCATTDPSVKTDVSYYIDWIEKQIADTYPSENLCFRKDD